MSLTLTNKLHILINRYNVLERPTTKINNYFQTHPKVYKAAILADHAIRTIVMTGFMMAFPTAIVPCGIYSLASSVFYRLTVESNCAYKFALPSFAGCVSVMVAYKPIVAIIKLVAFASFKSLSKAFLGIIPMALYVTYVVLTVNYDVEQKLGHVCDSCLVTEEGAAPAA